MARTERLKAHQIYDTVKTEAEEELRRGSASLAFSGLAAGFVLGLSAIGQAGMTAAGGSNPSQAFVALLYPIGFVAVITGRAQLFTENTLYPVVPILEHPHRIGQLLRLWAIVLLANVVGALVFALLAVKTSALASDIESAVVDTGHELLAQGNVHLFWSAVVAGVIIAYVAWLVSAADSTVARAVLTWFLIYLIGLGEFVHSIAGSTETLSAVLAGAGSWAGYGRWIAVAVAGNVVGGTGIVALVNYGQVRGSG